MKATLEYKGKKYKISSDANGYTIHVLIKTKKKEAKSKWTTYTQKYTNSMKGVVDTLIELNIRAADTKTMKELLAEIKTFNTFIMQELTGIKGKIVIDENVW